MVAVSVVGSVASPASAQTTLRQAAADDFFVGAALGNNFLSNPTYANIAGSQFSSVTAENSMKWDTTEPSPNQFNFGPGNQIVQFAQQNNQHVYGHTLVWHSQTPSWVQSLGSCDQLLSAMRNHITALLTQWPDVGRWDVVNEVIDDNGGQFRNSFWFQRCGSTYIAEAFRAARQADPDAVLCMNDYSIDGINTKSDAYFQLVQQLRSQGVPINCMSFQAHLILGQVPSSMQQNLQRFANINGIDEIWITELDIRIPRPVDSQELQQQAADYRRVYEICQNVPKCAGVTVWGVHDGQSWVDSTFPEFDSPLLWDDNFQPKPAFNAVLDQLGGGNNNQPPSAPTGLTATAGETNIQLTWNASAGATEYQILRAPGASGGTFTQVGTSTTTSFNDTGLPTNTTFRYQVTASNANGTSQPSNTVVATTGDDSQTPGPGGCTAAATVQTEWGEGYVIQPVLVTNTGTSTVTSWEVSFTLPAGHTLVNMWNAQPSGTTGTITAENMSYNGTLAPNSNTNFGFQVNRPSGDTSTPASFSCSAS
ncbi:MAG TPA: endo-1,4-beta-xylanase [Natronosporangium sp.]